MKRFHIANRILPLACVLVLLTGCGADSNVGTGREIVLQDPVTAAVNSEKAQVRTIRDAKIYTGFVFPETEEYGFGDAANISGTFVYPGDEVNAGDILVTSDISNMQNNIDKTVKKFEEYTEEYENYVAAQNTLLAELQQKMNLGVSSTEYKILSYKKEALEREMEEKKRLYELDYEYGQTYIEQMKAAMTSNSVSAGIDGTVVAIGGVRTDRNHFGPYLASYNAGWGDAVVAVADTGKLHIKCPYLAKNVINKAKEIYALINGQRVEVEYVPMSTDEYDEIKEMNGNVYTTFNFTDVPADVQVGDFVCIVLVNDTNENVVSVSSSCLRKDENGPYVYVLKDGKSVYTPVKTGMKDSMYTAILSGLSEGDEVLGASKAEYGTQTIMAKKGDFKTVFTGEGTILYPKKTSVVSTIEHGKVSFEGAKVSMFQTVKKGDILATVRVEIDEAEFQKQKTQLERLEQRFADFVAAGTQGKDVELAQKEKELQEQRELVEKMTKDSVTTQIVAPVDGIVISLNQYFQNGRLTYGTEVAQIADASCCYIMADNSNQQLTLGTDVTITYKTAQNKDAEIIGEVVSMIEMGVSRPLSSDYAFVRIEEDDIADLAGGIMHSWGRCEIKADIRAMKNVIVIPKNAVTELNGTSYVNVVNADGSITTQSILAGGYNNENYWVAAGLTEGMELCLK